MSLKSGILDKGWHRCTAVMTITLTRYYETSLSNLSLGQDNLLWTIIKMRNESQKTIMRQISQWMERLDPDGLEKVIGLAAGMLKTKIPGSETMIAVREPPTDLHDQQGQKL